MSVEAVRALLEEAEREPELRSALEGALRDRERPVESFLDAAQEHGYDFTADEFLEVVERGGQIGSGELSDSDLDSVAGGASWSGFATSLFRSYRSSPGIKQIGSGGLGQAEEEEEIQT